MKFWKQVSLGWLLLVLSACGGQELPTADPQGQTAAAPLLPTALAAPTAVASPTLEMEQVQPSLAAPEPALDCSGSPTPAQQQGPFFSPGSPERRSLIDPGMPGTPIRILGAVFDTDCQPLEGIKLDFWLADVAGEYDNRGFRLRGHVFADAAGYFSLETIEPTEYTGRPPHIHVKVFNSQGMELLTTQIYFSGSESSPEVLNNPELFVRYAGKGADGMNEAWFVFIIAR